MNMDENNVRIARNAIYLYFRTFAVLIVSLYTSRLVLQLLGITDLGIYNVVGGVVALLTFFQASLSKATSRFLAYDIGAQKSAEESNKTFGACITVHLIVAVLVLLFGESIGLFLINYTAKIPDSRWVTANVVYQFSLFVFIVHIVRLPFDSVIISHEKMSFYAYISIVEVVLQLALVKILFLVKGDPLFYYSLMILLIALFLLLMYVAYIKRNYPRYRISLVWDKVLLRKIWSFSGWTMVGSTANSVTQQGVVLLINNFVGLAANAALGFAGQVNAAVSKFVTSFTTAFNPQIIKLYAKKDISAMQLLVNRSSKFSFLLAMFFASPLIINMDYILSIWLDSVPLYTTEFCQILVVCLVFDATTGSLNTSITASGKLKIYQICLSISFLLDFCVAFLLLKNECSPILVFVSRIVSRCIINMFIGFYFVRKDVGLLIYPYIKNVLLPAAVTVVVVITFFTIVKFNFGIIGFGLSSVFSWIVLIFCGFTFVLNSQERRTLFNIIKKKMGMI